MLIVKKFGGSSVADKECIFRVAERCAEDYKNGHDVIVVLSAMGDTTDDLIAKAKEINLNPSKREMDMLLTTGEQISVSLMAMAFHKLGIPAVSLNAFQVKMHSTSTYGNARFKKVESERILHELGYRKIVIVTGFQGVNKYEDYATMGRGGSDTTAVAIAAALGADACEIYTDVDGVYTADPRIVPSARKLKEISYDEMQELASMGANVLHNRSVEMAKKYGVELEVLSSLTRKPGTIVREANKMEEMLISGIAKDNEVARVSIIGVPDRPGLAFKIFTKLAAKEINVDIILQSIGRNNTKDISFTIPESQLDETMEILRTYVETIGAADAVYDGNVSKVSVVGAGMETHPGVAAQMFEALFDANINIQMISTSEIKISVLISRDDADQAVTAIHKKFFSGK